MTSCPRVVSLVPSVTETLLSWGVEPVACTRFCEQPSINNVGGTKDPDLDVIENLKPDLVVMDREENRREDYQSLMTRSISVESLHVSSLADVEPEIRRLAARLDLDWTHVLSPHMKSINTFNRNHAYALTQQTHANSYIDI